MRWLLPFLPAILEILGIGRQDTRREIFSLIASIVFFVLAIIAGIVGLGFILVPVYHLIVAELGPNTTSIAMGTMFLLGAGLFAILSKKRF